MFDYDLDDVDDNGIYTVAAVAGAGALTLAGALVTGTVATMDYARRIAQITAGNDAGITFTYVGTDADGLPLTEVLAGGAGTPSTETTTGYFKTITSITASGAAAGNVTIGTVDEIKSQTVPIDWASDSPCAIHVDITGTINYTVQETFSAIHGATSTVVQSAAWTDITAFAAGAIDVKGTATAGATAIRLVVNTHSSAAEAQMYVSQPVRG